MQFRARISRVPLDCDIEYLVQIPQGGDMKSCILTTLPQWISLNNLPFVIQLGDHMVIESIEDLVEIISEDCLVTIIPICKTVHDLIKCNCYNPSSSQLTANMKFMVGTINVTVDIFKRELFMIIVTNKEGGIVITLHGCNMDDITDTMVVLQSTLDHTQAVKTIRESHGMYIL